MTLWSADHLPPVYAFPRTSRLNHTAPLGRLESRLGYATWIGWGQVAIPFIQEIHLTLNPKRPGPSSRDDLRQLRLSSRTKSLRLLTIVRSARRNFHPSSTSSLMTRGFSS